MSTDLKLVVGGVDVTQWVVQDSWSISQQWSRQGDTASFTLVDEHAVGAATFTVAPLATVVLTDNGLGQTLFSGVVPVPSLKVDGPLVSIWQLDCVDYTYLSDRVRVVGDYANYTVDRLVVTVTTLAACGVTGALASAGGYVSPGPQIPRVQFNWCTLTEAWTILAKLASTSGTYGWYVDESRRLHFYDETQAVSSGLTLTDGIAAVDGVTVLAYGTDTFSYLWDASSIRNSVTVRGANYTSTRTDLFVGNGSQGSFPLTFVPDASNVAANAVLTVDAVAKTVSAETGSSADTDWVVVGNAANQWFLTTNTDAVPASTKVVSFTYPYLQPVVAQVTDPSSIAAFATLPNSGVLAYYISDTALPTLLAAQKRAQREVWVYSQPAERCEVVVAENFTGHVRAGQTMELVNATVPDSQASWVPGIDATYLILQNRITGLGGMLRSYALTGVRIGTNT